jgi:hypothetical protein
MAFKPNTGSDDAIELVLVFLWEITCSKIKTFIVDIETGLFCGLDKLSGGIYTCEVVISHL